MKCKHSTENAQELSYKRGYKRTGRKTELLRRMEASFCPGGHAETTRAYQHPPPDMGEGTNVGSEIHGGQNDQ